MGCTVDCETTFRNILFIESRAVLLILYIITALWNTTVYLNISRSNMSFNLVDVCDNKSTNESRSVCALINFRFVNGCWKPRERLQFFKQDKDTITLFIVQLLYLESFQSILMLFAMRTKGTTANLDVKLLDVIQ